MLASIRRGLRLQDWDWSEGIGVVFRARIFVFCCLGYPLNFALSGSGVLARLGNGRVSCGRCGRVDRAWAEDEIRDHEEYSVVDRYH